MKNCHEMSELIQWMRGLLDENVTQLIGEHVENCMNCCHRLEELTDDPAIEPPRDLANFSGEASFANEPHFATVRKNLAKRIADLENSNQKPAYGDSLPLKNCFAEAENHSDIDTVIQKSSSTLAMGQTRNSADVFENAFVIDGYHLEELIGAGGFAHVFKAWDKRLERNVAIKILDQRRLNHRNRHRFLREAKTASTLDSQHIVRVLTSGETNNRPYIVMELVQGHTMADWIERASSTGCLPLHTIHRGVELLIQVCLGAQVAHDAGLVHRDIKPGNIFISQKNRTAKLGDFGLARMLDQESLTLTRAAEITGTPAYMSPEQTAPQSPVDPQSDVYSLGATLYHILTGQPPFFGSPLSIVKQVSEVEPLPPRQLNENVSRDLETICLQAIEKEPSRRYLTARELALELERTIAGQPILARPTTGAQKYLRWAKKNSILTTVMAMFFLTLIAGTAVSTTLWLSSSRNAAIAERRAKSLQTSKDSLSQTQGQLIDSVRNLVADSLGRKSTYLQLSAGDRQSATDTLVESYNSIFNAMEDDAELLFQLSTDAATATDVNLELGFNSAGLQLTEMNVKIVDRLLELPGPTTKHRAVAAWVYNQLGECLDRLPGQLVALQNGSQLWASSHPSEITGAAQAYLKAQSIAAGSDASVPELYLQRLRAKRFIISYNEKNKGPSDAGTTSLLELLDSVVSIRNHSHHHSHQWMAFHGQLLLTLSKRSTGQDKVNYRLHRRNVFIEFIDRISEANGETFWYDRIVAVNDIFLGLELRQLGQLEEGLNSIDRGVERLEGLVAAFPQNVQFHAGVAEAQMILAGIAWDENRISNAFSAYEYALREFEANLKIDSEAVGFRRRVSHVYELVGNQYITTKKTDQAKRCFTLATRHIRAVIASKAEPLFESSDNQFLTRLKKQLQDE